MSKNLLKLHQESGGIVKWQHPRSVKQHNICAYPEWKLTRSWVASPCEFIGKDLKVYFNKILLQSVLSHQSHRAAQLLFCHTLLEMTNSLGTSVNAGWNFNKIKSLQKRKMLHGIPSCWNMIGKDSTICGAKALLKARSRGGDLRKKIKVLYFIRWGFCYMQPFFLTSAF